MAFLLAEECCVLLGKIDEYAKHLFREHSQEADPFGESGNGRKKKITIEGKR